jgi:HPt (histidine-containing phosphotransfer) domain-containing protein
MKNNSSNAVDREFLKSIVENDVEFERELFNIFTENANRNIKKLDEAIKTGDNNAWYMSAHAFKGASASIGAFELSKILEYAQKNPEESPEQKQELMNKVREEFSRVLDFINEELL